jgi:two-component system, OmpR family, alkaline phosphatase synthesis response regulator PhoP
MNRLLLVEDDELLGTMVKLNLEAEGDEVTWLVSGGAAVELASEQVFDLIILDIALPEKDGTTILRELRARGNNAPVLMLTARSEVSSKVGAFEIGADDYVTKPFELDELMARVHALLRRSRAERQVPAERILRIGRFSVDLDTRQATTRLGPQVLSEREVALLELLARAGGRPLSRHDILDEVWGMDAFPTARTVDNFLLKLRKLFEDDPRRPKHILTIRGVGYRLVLPS